MPRQYRSRTRRCTDCNEPTLVHDLDAPAVCPACVGERRADESAFRENPQAGAQFVGRERGTRDDVLHGRLVRG